MAFRDRIWMHGEKPSNQALLFSPEHLSCYQLTLEEKTPLGRRYRKGEFRLPEEDFTVRLLYEDIGMA